MGSTLTALQSGGGRFTWVVAIEGYEYLLTNGSTSAAVTAWSGTPWTSALSGLHVQMDSEQRIDPWSVELDPGECVLTIDPDASDTFGIDVHKGGAGTTTYLETALDCDDTSVVGLNTSAFAASGSIYVGLERIAYSANDGTDTFTVSTRGQYAPFSIDGGTNTWGRAHPLPTVDFDVSQKPIISSVPRSWLGKWVGVWLHRTRDGVLDTKAQAQLVFAGTIEEVNDTSDGKTIVRCVDVKEQLNRTTLLHDQWTAVAEAGIFLTAGTTFYVISSGATTGDETTTPLVVGDGIAEGTYTVPELCVELTTWLQADAALSGDWLCTVSADGHFLIVWTPPAGSHFQIQLYTDRYVLRKLGWTNVTGSGYGAVIGDLRMTGVAWLEAPSPYTTSIVIDDSTSTQTISNLVTKGTWFNNLAYFPPQIYSLTDGSGSWAVIQFNNQLALCKYSSATEVTNVILLDELGAAMHDTQLSDISFGDDREQIIRQIVILSGSLVNIMSRLFASTGTSGYNHATYDAFQASLGAAIPWELLGTEFVNSLTALGASTANDSIVVVLEKPTRLWQAIGADLMLRASYLVFKNATLRFATLRTPNAVTYDHTWTEDDKASAESSDNQRTITRTTSDFVRNVLILKYDRGALAGNNYNATVEARFTRSIQELGGESAQTIECRNSYSAFSWTGLAVEELAADLIATVLPVFGWPLKVMTRSISPKYYEDVAPGDLVLVTDSHARSAATGARGIADKPGLVIAHRRSFGGDGDDAFGEAEILFNDDDSIVVYCPTAEVSSYAASVYTCTEHTYSESSDAVDASRFAVDDEVTIIEIDPADPASPDSHSATVTDVTGNDITVDAAHATYDAGKKYRIISQAYGSAVTAQQSKAYLADDADGLIANARGPYKYGQMLSASFTASTATELPERHSTANIGDGSALATGPAAGMAKAVNNLVSYATAPHGPVMFEAAASVSTTGYTLIACFPYYIGKGSAPAGKRRRLTIAPMIAIANAAASARARVTVSRLPPRGDTGVAVTFYSPNAQLVFDSSSTTMATITAQQCTPYVDANTGVGWITVELKTDNASYAATCWGLSKFWLGPLEAI